MADRIKRLKKEDRKIPKNNARQGQADHPRRISHGIIGVRKLRRSSTKSNTSNGSNSGLDSNPFADLLPHQRSSVTVLTSYNQNTGRTTHLRRKSKVKGISKALAQSRALTNKEFSLAQPRNVSVQSLLARSSNNSSPSNSPKMRNEWEQMPSPNRSPRQTAVDWGSTKPSPKMAQGGWGFKSASQSPRQQNHAFDNPPIAPVMPKPVSDLSRLQKGKVAERIQQFSPILPASFPNATNHDRSSSRQSLEHGFVTVDDDKTIKAISNDKVDRFLASLGGPPLVSPKRSTFDAPKAPMPTTNPRPAQPPVQRSQNKSPESTSSWSTSSSVISAPIVPLKSARRSSSRVSETGLSPNRENTVRKDDRDETASLTPSDSRSDHKASATSPRKQDARSVTSDEDEEMFRGVKVSWLIKTYNDYLASKLDGRNDDKRSDTSSTGLHTLLLPSAVQTTRNDENPASRQVNLARRSSKVIFGPPRRMSRTASPAASQTSVDNVQEIVKQAVKPEVNQEVKPVDLMQAVKPEVKQAVKPADVKPSLRPLGPVRINTDATVQSVPMARGRSMPSEKEPSTQEPIPQMPKRATSRPAVLRKPDIPTEPVPLPSVPVQGPVKPAPVEPAVEQNKLDKSPDKPIGSTSPSSPRSIWKPISLATGLWSTHIAPQIANTTTKLPTPFSSATTNGQADAPSKSEPVAIPQRNRADSVDDRKSHSYSPSARSISPSRSPVAEKMHDRSKSQGPDRRKLTTNNVAFYDPFSSPVPPVPTVPVTRPPIPSTFNMSPRLKRTPSPLQAESLVSRSKVEEPSTVEPAKPPMPSPPLSQKQADGASTVPSPSRTVRRIMKQQLASPPPSPATEARDQALLAYPAPPKINEQPKQMTMLGLAAEDEARRAATPSRASDSSEDDLLPRSKPSQRGAGVSTKAQKLLGMSARGAAFETKQKNRIAAAKSAATSPVMQPTRYSSGMRSQASGHSSKPSQSSILRGRSISSIGSEGAPKQLVEPLKIEETSIFNDPNLAPDRLVYGSPSPTPSQYQVYSIENTPIIPGIATPTVESVGGNAFFGKQLIDNRPVGKRPNGLTIQSNRNTIIEDDEVSPGSAHTEETTRDADVDDLSRRPSSVYTKSAASPQVAVFASKPAATEPKFYQQAPLGIHTGYSDADDGSKTPTDEKSSGMFGNFNFAQKSNRSSVHVEDAAPEQSLSPPVQGYGRGSDASSIGTLDTKERMQKSRDSSFGSAASMPGGPQFFAQNGARGKFGRLEPIEQSPLPNKDVDSFTTAFKSISRESTPPTPSAAEFRGLGLGISSHGSSTALDQILHAETTGRPRPHRVTTLDRINSSAQNPQAAAKINRPPIPSTAHFIPPNYPISRTQRPTSTHSASSSHSNVSSKSSNVPISYYQPRTDKVAHDPFKNLDVQQMTSRTNSRRPSSVPSISKSNLYKVEPYHAIEPIAEPPQSTNSAASSEEHEYVLRPAVSPPKQRYYDQDTFDFQPPSEPRQRPSPITRSNSVKSKKGKAATQMNSNEVHEKFDIRRALANSSEEESDETIASKQQQQQQQQQSYLPHRLPEDDSLIGMASSATAALSKWFG